MKQTRILMGMPITVEVLDEQVRKQDFRNVFRFFQRVEKRYSPYLPSSELSQINRGLPRSHWSREMKQIMELCHQTRIETGGYFNINRGGSLDTSGLVKGWSIKRAAELLARRGFKNFYVEAGGDIQVRGKNPEDQPWKVGLRNPFNRHENIKVINIDDEGVATSGTYIRGQHVYNPKRPRRNLRQIVSLTVIGPDIYEADRMATAALAMGRRGIAFIESLSGFEGYSIDKTGMATMTSGFERYTA